jgi:pilus assembly protein Flp/PilA
MSIAEDFLRNRLDSFSPSLGTSMSSILRFIVDESGVTAIEYGLIASLIALVIVTSISSIGTPLNNFFIRIAGCITTNGVSC